MIRADAAGHDVCLDKEVMTRRFTVELRKATRTILLTVATLLTPAALSAQFTTFVAPPRKAAVDSPATVVAAKARADSVARMSLTDMKTWVDSAAGTSTQVASATDTTMAAANAAAPAVQAPAATAHETTTFSNGAIAPNTASALPAYLATGLALFSVGLFLLRRRRRAEVNARRDG
jgi:LPXTG-motif cell wall-anchored protein